MSLLTIIQQARLRTNQSKPTTAFANADTGIQQMIALLQDIGDEVAERNQWQALNISGTITGDGTTTIFPFAIGTLIDQTTPEATDVDFGGLSNGLRFISSLVPLLPLIGPVTNEQMAAFKAFPLGLIRPVWRVINGNFEFFPALAAGEIATFNYYSTNWILNSAGLRAKVWAADTDTPLLDPKILSSGLEWRWLKAKGLDYGEEFRRYEMRIDRADGRQDTRRDVSMSRRRTGGYDTWPGLIPLPDDEFNSDFGGGGFS